MIYFINHNVISPKLSMKSPAFSIAFRIFSWKFFVFLISFSALVLFSSQGYAQNVTGPGGVGSMDGTSNLELWLDANTITGLSDGDNVTSWADVSGNGLTAVSNDTTTEEPTFNTNIINSIFPSISFDPSDGTDYLNLGNPGSLDFVPGTDSWSFFIVSN